MVRKGILSRATKVKNTSVSAFTAKRSVFSFDTISGSRGALCCAGIPNIFVVRVVDTDVDMMDMRILTCCRGRLMVFLNRL